MNHDYKVRISALSGIDDLIAALGGDAGVLLKNHDLSPAKIYADNSVITVYDFVKMLYDCASELNTPDFGLMLGSTQDIRVLGPVADLLAEQETQLDALNIVRRHLFFHNQSEYWDYETHNGNFYLRRYDLFHDMEDTRQYIELAFSACFQMLNASVGGVLQGARLEFSHSPISERNTYQEYFKGIPVKFNCEQDQWIIPSHYLEKPYSNATQNKVCHGPESMLDGASDELLYHVSATIQKNMAFHNQSIIAVAEALHMNVRTLQRHLKARNVIFRELLQDIRGKSACWYLTSSDISITVLSEMLGYNDVSNFSRAFRKTFGLSPLQWRKRKFALRRG